MAFHLKMMDGFTQTGLSLTWDIFLVPSVNQTKIPMLLKLPFQCGRQTTTPMERGGKLCLVLKVTVPRKKMKWNQGVGCTGEVHCPDGEETEAYTNWRKARWVSHRRFQSNLKFEEELETRTWEGRDQADTSYGAPSSISYLSIPTLASVMVSTDRLSPGSQDRHRRL